MGGFLKLQLTLVKKFRLGPSALIDCLQDPAEVLAHSKSKSQKAVQEPFEGWPAK